MTQNNRPGVTIIHGDPGTGKTSLAAQFPDCLFGIDAYETGIFDLKQAHLVSEDVSVAPPFEKFQDVLDLLGELKDRDHTFAYLVLETLNGIQRLIHEAVVQECYGGDAGPKGFMNYQEGYRTATPYVRKFIQACEDLRNEKNTAIVITAHSWLQNVKNPQGSDYDKVFPRLHRETWGPLCGWASCVLYLQDKVSIKKDKDDPTAIVKTIEKVIVTQGNAAIEAKNRWNLPAEISCGKNAKEAFQALVGAKKMAFARNLESNGK